MRKLTVEGLEAPRLTVFISVPLAGGRSAAVAVARSNPMALGLRRRATRKERVPCACGPN